MSFQHVAFSAPFYQFLEKYVIITPIILWNILKTLIIAYYRDLNLIILANFRENRENHIHDAITLAELQCKWVFDRISVIDIESMNKLKVFKNAIILDADFF